MITTVLLQILSNVANDYGDSVHGADHAGRQGPARAVQSGAITRQAMKRAVWIFALLSLVSGIALLYMAFGWNARAFLFFLALGLLSILAAVGYTAGKKPYGYVGLGDASVMIFFGWVGVGGTYYLLTRQLDYAVVLPAISCGAFAVGVLNINNVRDIESDRAAGKFSLPVRMGKKWAAHYHAGLIVVGLGAALAYTVLHWHSPWQLLFLVTVVFFVPIARAVIHKPSSELDPYLKRMAVATLLFVLLFGAGLLMR
jgi:1,4-dihydroxy-2-naphthoate octaprenyltransferase